MSKAVTKSTRESQNCMILYHEDIVPQGAFVMGLTTAERKEAWQRDGMEAGQRDGMEAGQREGVEEMGETWICEQKQAQQSWCPQGLAEGHSLVGVCTCLQ